MFDSIKANGYARLCARRKSLLITRRRQMTEYYVNKNAQPNGDHEVHREGCRWLPLPQNRIALGKFYTCHGAVAEARKYYRQVNGDYFCSRECHTG